jgi:hypothetical protein
LTVKARSSHKTARSDFYSTGRARNTGGNQLADEIVVESEFFQNLMGVLASERRMAIKPGPRAINPKRL